MRLRQLTLAFALAAIAATHATTPAAAQTDRVDGTGGGDTDEVAVSIEGDGPAVLFDGVEISRGELADLDAGGIGDIQILSGEEAGARFGKYERFGVIVVTSAAAAPAVQETVTESSSAPAERVLQTSDAPPPGVGQRAAAAAAAGGPVAARGVADVRRALGAGTKPYVLIDGKPADLSALEALDPGVIRQVQVHKGLDAVDLFGERAAEGAVIVVTKGR